MKSDLQPFVFLKYMYVQFTALGIKLMTGGKYAGFVAYMYAYLLRNIQCRCTYQMQSSFSFRFLVCLCLAVSVQLPDVTIYVANESKQCSCKAHRAFGPRMDYTAEISESLRETSHCLVTDTLRVRKSILYS